MGSDRRGRRRGRASRTQIECRRVGRHRDTSAGGEVRIGGGRGSAAGFDQQDSVGRELCGVADLQRRDMGDGGGHRRVRHSDKSAADTPAFRVRIGGGCREDGDAARRRPRFVAWRLEDGVRMDRENAFRRECHRRIRYADSNHAAAIALGNGRHVANSLRLNIDVPDGGEHGAGMDRRRDFGRRRQVGRHRRDLHHTARGATGGGFGDPIRGGRLVRAKNQSTCRRCLAMHRKNRDIVTSRETGSGRDLGRHRRGKSNRGVQDRDCHRSSACAVIRRVGVRPRVGSNRDVVPDVDRARDPSIHRRSRIRLDIGNTHLDEAATPSVRPRQGPVVGRRPDDQIECAGTGPIRSCHIAEHQRFCRALGCGGGGAVLDIDAPAAVIHRVGDGQILRIRGNGDIARGIRRRNQDRRANGDRGPSDAVDGRIDIEIADGDSAAPVGATAGIGR